MKMENDIYIHPAPQHIAEVQMGKAHQRAQIEIVHLKNHVIVLIVLLKNPSGSKVSWWMIAGESPPSWHKATEPVFTRMLYCCTCFIDFMHVRFSF